MVRDDVWPDVSDCVRAGGVVCEAGHKDCDAARVFGSPTMQTGGSWWEGGMGGGTPVSWLTYPDARMLCKNVISNDIATSQFPLFADTCLHGVGGGVGLTWGCAVDVFEGRGGTQGC